MPFVRQGIFSGMCHLRDDGCIHDSVDVRTRGEDTDMNVTTIHCCRVCTLDGGTITALPPVRQQRMVNGAYHWRYRANNSEKRT